MFDNDPTRGWSPDATAYRELWNAVTTGGTYGGGDWAATYGAAMADPESGLSQALVGAEQRAA